MGSREQYYQLSVVRTATRSVILVARVADQTDIPIIDFLDPRATPDRLMKWSGDSGDVTFFLPGHEIRLGVNASVLRRRQKTAVGAPPEAPSPKNTDQPPDTTAPD